MKAKQELLAHIRLIEKEKPALIEIDKLMHLLSAYYDELAMAREAYVQNLSSAVPKITSATSALIRQQQTESYDPQIAETKEDVATIEAEKISETVIDQTDEVTEVIETTQHIADEALKHSKAEEPIEDEHENFIVEQILKRKPEDDFLKALGIKKEVPLPNREIRKFIGLNDRLLYTNMLFAGSNDKYEAALQEINLQDNASDAKRVVQALIVHQGHTKEERDEALHLLFTAIEQTFIL